MEPWMQTLITGVVPLIAAFGGYALSSFQEKRHRKEDRDRADKISQRQAVARFLENSNKLAAKSDTFKKETLAFEQAFPILSQSQIERITDPRAEYYDGILAELEILDLYLHDENVRKSFIQLSDICKSRHEDLLKLAEYPDYLAQFNLENQYPVVMDILSHGPHLEEIVTARNELLRSAREHFSLESAQHDNFTSMVTPFDRPIPEPAQKNNLPSS